MKLSSLLFLTCLLALIAIGNSSCAATEGQKMEARVKELAKEHGWRKARVMAVEERIQRKMAEPVEAAIQKYRALGDTFEEVREGASICAELIEQFGMNKKFPEDFVYEVRQIRARQFDVLHEQFMKKFHYAIENREPITQFQQYFCAWDPLHLRTKSEMGAISKARSQAFRDRRYERQVNEISELAGEFAKMYMQAAAAKAFKQQHLMDKGICPICSGKKKILATSTIDCNLCGGSGTTYGANGSIWCPSCHAHGSNTHLTNTVTCPSCSGTGKYP